MDKLSQNHQTLTLRKTLEDCVKTQMLLTCCTVLLQIEYNRISGCETAKEIWDKLEVTYEGTSKVKEAKIDLLQQQMEMFRMEPKETINDMNTRFVSLANELKRLGKEMTEPEMVKKFLRSLTKDWEAKKTAIEEAHNLNSYSY